MGFWDNLIYLNKAYMANGEMDFQKNINNLEVYWGVHKGLLAHKYVRQPLLCLFCPASSPTGYGSPGLFK